MENEVVVPLVQEDYNKLISKENTYVLEKETLYEFSIIKGNLVLVEV